jgi:AraC family transcriptional regulator of adaptative response / methylphosphotriester-DNA alkyltransferase methyltransferase
MTPPLNLRRDEITSAYLKALDRHLADLLADRTLDMMEVNEIAEQLNIHPTHLSNTIKLTTGKSACYFYEHKIIDIAKALLQDPSKSISHVARLLTYDPSNFTKFFKAYVNQTPGEYRKACFNKK